MATPAQVTTMKICEIKVTLTPIEKARGSNLRAFVNFTLADEMFGKLALHDTKVIERSDGKIFLAMPSKVIAWPCVSDKCVWQNPAHAKFCNGCGIVLPDPAVNKSHHDFYHPVDVQTRDVLEGIILEEFHRVTAMAA